MTVLCLIAMVLCVIMTVLCLIVMVCVIMTVLCLIVMVLCVIRPNLLQPDRGDAIVLCVCTAQLQTSGVPVPGRHSS